MREPSVLGTYWGSLGDGRGTYLGRILDYLERIGIVFWRTWSVWKPSLGRARCRAEEKVVDNRMPNNKNVNNTCVVPSHMYTFETFDLHRTGGA